MYLVNKTKITLALLSFSFLASCNSNSITNISTQSTEKGQIKIKLFSPVKDQSVFGKFRVKYIDPTDVFNGNLSVYGLGITTPITNGTVNPIRLPDGKNITPVYFTANSIPVGNNRIIKINGLDKSLSSLGSQVTIMGVANVSSTYPNEAEVSWRTTPTAKVIDRLITLGSQFSATVDNQQLQALVDKIITNDTSGVTSDDIHPSLVNTTAIAAYINNNSGNLPTISNASDIANYRTPGQTISGKVNGVTYTVVGTNQAGIKYKPTIKIICNDPSSSPLVVTDVDGNYTLSGVTPGTGYTVKAITDYYDEAVQSNVASGATSINFAPNKQHYIENSINNSYGISRFPTTRSIKVQIIIPSSGNASTIGYTQANYDAVVKGINAWQNMASDKLSFTILPDIYDNDANLTSKKINADIYVQWTKNFSGNVTGITQTLPNTSDTSVPPGAGAVLLNTSSMPYYNDYRAAVSLATSYSDGTKLSDFILPGVATHEIGHALGLALVDPGTGSTHPQSNADDLMYPQVNSSSPTNLNISARDLNTLRFLYEIPANITTN